VARASATPAPDAGATGALYALLAYGWWGLTPLYWRALVEVPALEILAHRVVWTLVLVSLLLWLAGGWRDVRQVLADPRRFAALALSGGLLAVNWLIFIWAVNSDQVLAASLGYYLNPLINVALGAVVLRERLARPQWLAVVIAAFGVGYMAFELRSLPWISVALAISFAIYGLIRKTVPVSSLGGLEVEMLVLAPLALGFVAWLELDGHGAFARLDLLGPVAGVLLVGSGVATALPLIWFASAARRLRLSTVGLFQYLAPSLNFVLAVALFGEAFTASHAVTFGCIWLACVLYAVSSRSPRPIVAAGSP
jgi:chloramphenicol-sensitive protein RarD